jgi:Na+-transporting NADH:ubiquinone oxidoreductase subunit A
MRGLDIHLGAAPDMRIAGTRQATAAAVLGRDFSGVKFDILTEPGAQVRAGEPVLRDRHRPEVVFTAPVSGRVAGVKRGARRALQSIRFAVDDTGEAVRFDIPVAMDKGSVRALMLRSGLWTALRKRPFGHIPDPKAEPRALLVTAIDTEPLAPDPVCIIAEYSNHFVSGLRTLALICDAPVFLCQADGADIPATETDRVKVVEFSGPHPAGLAGTHIHALSPIGFDGTEAWHIGYQDVISLGHLVNEGTPWRQRVVSFAGTGVERPRLLGVSVCTAIDDVATGECVDSPVRIISGSALSGHEAVGAEAFLGQRHNQITALVETPAVKPQWWRRGGYTIDQAQDPGALIPTTDMERMSPPGILPVPMLRALLVADVDRARDLGALELIEEDLALLSYACSSGNPYGRLLRNVLDQLCKEAV